MKLNEGNPEKPADFYQNFTVFEFSIQKILIFCD